MHKKILSILFTFFITTATSISQTNEYVPLDNIIQHKKPKAISSLVFDDFSGNKIKLTDYVGKLVILNFWATWCQPCKEEMPSLDNLYINKKFNNLYIFPINTESPNKIKTKNFFTNLNISNLQIFFDNDLSSVKSLSLRGVPTTVFINKEGKEFARILGSIDFEDNKFIDWLAQYD